MSDDQAAQILDPNNRPQPVVAKVPQPKKVAVAQPAATPKRPLLAPAPSVPSKPGPDFLGYDEPLAPRTDVPRTTYPAPPRRSLPQSEQVHQPQPRQNNEEDGSLSDMASYDRAAVWHGHTSQSMSWTTASIQLIREHWSQLNRANDVNEFCPGYHSASRKQQEICWLRIIGGIVQFESDFKPADKYRESNGVWSVGLMAMSVGQCPGASSMSALQQAIPNLKCGITNFAKWAAEGSSISEKRGAGRNWSTLRSPYTVYAGGKRLSIGKKKQIEAIAMGFKRY